jgi:hypothetical protein
MVTDEQIMQVSEQLNNLIVTQWVNQYFLSPTWFFVVFLIFFSYALFIYLADKERIIEILLFGSLVAVTFSVYDSLGQQFGYWFTLKGVLPFNPNFFLGDLTLIPLYAMLVYQYTSSWRSFILWNTVWAGLFSYGFYNALLGYLKVFVYIKPFSVLLDFVLFMIVGLISRAIMVALFKLEANKGKMSSKLSLSMLIDQPSSRSSIGKNKR